MKLNSIGLLPNYRNKEFNIAAKLLFQFSSPSEQPGSFRQKLMKFMSENHSSEKKKFSFYLLDSARSAFSVLLSALELAPGSEVIMPSFTCVVITNPVIWNDLKPVYVDISRENFNPTVENYINLVTNKTKVVVVQHTFGLQVNIHKLKDELKKINREDIVIVEDLAHSFGQKYYNHSYKVGSEAHFSVVTFGFEKVISSLRGGLLICNLDNNFEDARLVDQKVSEIVDSLPKFPAILTFRLLLNTQLWRIAIPFYYLGIYKITVGRVISILGRLLRIVGLAIEKGEYKANKPNYLPAKISPKLARLGEIQLSQIDELTEHRKFITKVYNHELQTTKYANNPETKLIKTLIENQSEYCLLRYPLVLDSKSEKNRILEKLSKHGFILGDWYNKILFTPPKNLEIFGYKKKQNPITEEIIDKIINLPTSIVTSEVDAKFIIQLISEE